MSTRILITLFLLILGIVNFASGAVYTDWLGGGHWDTYSMASTTSSDLSGLVGTFTVDGTHLWGVLHGNEGTGYGMWLTAVDGGGGEWNRPNPDPNPDSNDPAWIAYDFGEVYNLSTMWIWNYNQPVGTSRGLKDVTIDVSADGTTWTNVYTGVLAKATGQWLMPRTDFFIIGPVTARYVVISASTNWGPDGGTGYNYYGLSEVRWDLSLPTATNPNPANGAEVEGPNVPISWLPGAAAVQHDVYFGTDVNAVTNATVSDPRGVYRGRQPGATYNYGPLNYDTTYYWRIDEVDGSSNVITGNVWNFNVAEYRTIDNFESYADVNALQLVWQPVAGTGSAISLSKTAVIDKQSIQMNYTNSAAPYYSDVRAVFAAAQDWSEGGLFKSLSLSFFGRGTNSVTSMYVILEDSLGHISQAVYDGDTNYLKMADWNEWNIAYTRFSGVDMTKIKKITLRIGNGSTASSGKLYFDNIRRYITRCMDQPSSDINGDCVTNFQDYAYIGNSWLTNGLWP